jgi:hypothetical protein
MQENPKSVGEESEQQRAGTFERFEESVAPTALEEFLGFVPSLTGWAKFCRASGAQE